MTYSTKCESCGRKRTCNDAALCHECEAEQAISFLCDSCLLPTDDCTCIGGPYTAGGRAL
jgi:hypothetical protein